MMLSERPEQATILIVDDKLQELEPLRTFLKEKDFRISVAQNGEEALERAEYVRPDLILLDVLMPGMDDLRLAVASRNTMLPKKFR